MIDRGGRAAAATLVREFLAGAIDSDQLENEWPVDSADRALQAVGSMVWLFYDDHRPRTMVGKQAARPEEVELLERYAAFLDTDKPYDWPEDNFIRLAGLGPLVFISLGLLWPLHRWIKRRNERFDERMAAHGNLEVWPFSNEEDWHGVRRAPYVS